MMEVKRRGVEMRVCSSSGVNEMVEEVDVPVDSELEEITRRAHVACLGWMRC